MYFIETLADLRLNVTWFPRRCGQLSYRAKSIQQKQREARRKAHHLLTKLKATVPTKDEKVSRVGLKTGPDPRDTFHFEAGVTSVFFQASAEVTFTPYSRQMQL